ncbi:MAG: HAMP domain-containing sensor histidine kinase [Acidobacteria bacterium]|nr:HAMP domain-containing sensor histidine kinase [Acidobacteriota bacterium]
MGERSFDEQLVDVFVRLSRGDADARMLRTGRRDGQDVVAYLVNVLAEELTELLAERDRARGDLSSVVLELGDVLSRHAAGDFSARAKRRFDGSPADVLAYQVNSAGEEIDGLVNDLHAQRERFDREARTRATSRLSAVAVLAAGVAHEVNNPLTSILINLQLAQGQLAESFPCDDQRVEPVLERLRQAEAGVERVSSIVKTLRQLTTRERGEGAAVDVTTIVDSSLQMVRSIVDQQATLTCAHHDSLTVHVDGARLGQVVINLVHNAVLAFETASAADNRIDVTTRLEGPMAVIEVRDNGVGIAKEQHEAIFDAFFSTRSPQEGMGLGLAISRQTMLEFGGDLTVQSALGEGSTFRAVMPVRVDPEDSVGTV